MRPSNQNRYLKCDKDELDKIKNRSFHAFWKICSSKRQYFCNTQFA